MEERLKRRTQTARSIQISAKADKCLSACEMATSRFGSSRLIFRIIPIISYCLIATIWPEENHREERAALSTLIARSAENAPPMEAE